MVNRTYLLPALVSALVLAAPQIARADDSCAVCANRVAPDADADTNARLAKPPMRIGVYGSGAMGPLSRTNDTVTGFAIAGELGVAFDGTNGLRAGYADATSLFGPEVRVWDLDYSHQWNTAPRLRGVTGTLGVLVGPSLGYVDYEGNDPQRHVTFGGRAGVFADLDLWNFTVGVDASYRLGFSDFGYESMAVAGVHLGVTFDVARR